MASSKTNPSDRPPPASRFARRTSSGRTASLTRDDDLEMSSEFGSSSDYTNYTVMMPPTPDNQPGGPDGPAGPGDKSHGPPGRGLASGGEEGGSGKMDRRVSILKNNNKSMLLRSQTSDFDHNRWLFETKGKYGIGNAFWQEDENSFDESGMSMSDLHVKPWKPLTRKVKIPGGILSPYRILVVIRLVVLVLFLSWRIMNPNTDAMWLWGMSIVCECWFAFSWLLDILPKLNPINRQTDLEAFKDKFESPSPGNPQGRADLPMVDVFISTADPEKEPPLVTGNTILSILAVDYPIEKISVYISDDGGAILTFEAMAEAVRFAELWVPFCRKHNIEPRNPDSYFSSKIDKTKNKKKPDFVKDRRWIKREYDEYKVRINQLPDVIRKRCEMYNSKEEMQANRESREKNDGVETEDNAEIKAVKATWMADGTHWPGTWFNSTADHARGDHAGILQSFAIDKDSGKKCFMLGARELQISWGDTPQYWKWESVCGSRFSEVAILRLVWWFDIRCNFSTKMFSPNTAYSAFLVFKLDIGDDGFDCQPINVSLNSTDELGYGETMSTIYLKEIPDETIPERDGEMPKERSGEWLEVELGEVSVNPGENRLVKIRIFEVEGMPKSGLVIEGIEFRPKVIV